LTDDGHLVDVAASAEDGLRIAETADLDALVLDVRLPGIDGLSAMRQFRDLIGQAPIIVMTAFGNLETAVKAMEGGAFEYLVKPFDLDQAASVVKRAIDAGKSRVETLPSREDEAPAETIVGASPVMQELFRSIALVAPTDVPVLITGESGTGKELVARAIHCHSARRDRPFLPVCLAALSPSLIERELFGHVRGSFTGAEHDRKGLLELADGGTVLLDEIGDVPLALQVKLLRAIEHREVTPVGDARPRRADLRVVAATNRSLPERIASGDFREDLFFRLSVFQIHVPPLRERGDDIPLLAEHFLRRSGLPEAGTGSLSADVVRELKARPWTGNVRELRNTIEHAAIVARGQPIRPEHLPPPGTNLPPTRLNGGRDLQEKLMRWSRDEVQKQGGQAVESPLYDRYLELVEPPLIQAVLAQSRGNRAVAAQMLGIHRATLRQKLRKYSLE
jgi:two-component system nitrogen regulation response regulator GlnG